ncbi:hypothetical protein DER46DRAFT_659189 [Fusarium sp. MPI-SDFR-AT-0072]|nr:hypothetical protein DER46DRAFT_659189 [Fusarium sp. MPI-SDFR-AT-0072]
MSSPETQRRLACAKLIASTGYEIMPCSLCVENYTKCMMKDGWKNCSECTCWGRTCDGKGVTLTEEKNRIEADEEATEEELIQLQRQLNERLSKLMRLRRQKRLIQSKGLKALERDTESMSEREKAENLVAPPESTAVVESIEAGAVDLIDWSAILDPSLVFDGSSSEVAGH